MPTLYVIATPIGNLEDITLRAQRILQEVNLIAAEDTRETRKLLIRYQISTPLTSYNEHNKLRKLSYILERLATEDIALVSDAGTPGISDPGKELIYAAIKCGFGVIAVPGPSAIITALTVSGIPAERFVYLGFLPRRSAQRKRLLEEMSLEPGALVVLESPHRLQATLVDALHVLGDRQIAVCRELTKLHEEVFRGTIQQALEHFTSPKGEFTLVIAGCGRDKTSSKIEAAINNMVAPAPESPGSLSKKNGKPAPRDTT